MLRGALLSCPLAEDTAAAADLVVVVCGLWSVICGEAKAKKHP